MTRPAPLILEWLRDGGYLVKGTADEKVARQALPGTDADAPVRVAGWLRKVPSQWGGWALYDARPGDRGAFTAVVFEEPER